MSASYPSDAHQTESDRSIQVNDLQTVSFCEVGSEWKPAKLLFVIDTLEVGGTEQSLLQLCRYLDRARFDPMVCNIYSGSRLAPEFLKCDVPVNCLDIRGKYRFMKAFCRLRSLVRRIRPQLIHTMLFRSNQIGRAVARWERIPCVTSLVNVPYDPVRTRIDPQVVPGKLAMLRRLDAFTSRWASHFHAVSPAVRDSSCYWLNIPRDKVCVIPRGRELPSETDTQDAVRTSGRRALGLPLDAPVMLNVGRLVPQKGQDHLLQALASVVTRIPEVVLLVVGDGPLQGTLQSRAEELGVSRHVRFLGTRTDLDVLLRVADCFAMSSFYEGIPGAVIEAMLAGCPVVASDIPMLAGVIDGGVNGLLTVPEDPTSLSEALVRMLSERDLRRRLADQAQCDARHRFEIRSVVRRMEQWYQSVLESATPNRCTGRHTS